MISMVQIAKYRNVSLKNRKFIAICKFTVVFCAVRQSAPKLIEGNAGVTVLTPVATQNSVNIAVAGADGAIKTTQASMSGIQALAAAAAATQKITVSPQTAQLKLGNLIE